MIFGPPENIIVANQLQGAMSNFKIKWDEQPLAKSYRIYRGYVFYDSNFELIGTTKNLEFIDNNPILIDGCNNYYKVSSIKTDGTESQLSKAFHDKSLLFNKYVDNSKIFDKQQTNPLPINFFIKQKMKKITQDEAWLLQNVGAKCILVKRKNKNIINANDDEDDSDRLTGRQSRQINGITNEDLTIEFFDPIIIYARLTTPDQTYTIMSHGLLQEKNAYCWTIAEPIINDGDIIVDRNNDRWEINGVKRMSSWQNVITWQMWNIKAIPKTDDVFNHPKIKNLDGNLLIPKEG